MLLFTEYQWNLLFQLNDMTSAACLSDLFREIDLQAMIDRPMLRECKTQAVETSL